MRLYSRPTPSSICRWKVGWRERQLLCGWRTRPHRLCVGMLCKICFEDATTQGQARVTRCGHVFCFDCITKWTASGSSECPLCRKAIRVEELVTLYDDDAAASARPIESSDEVAAASKGAPVADFLESLSKRWRNLEKENSVLKIKVQQYEAEVAFLKGLVERDAEEEPRDRPRGGDEADADASPRAMGDEPRMGTTCSESHAMADCKPSRVFSTHDEPIHGISLSHTGTLVATASWDRTCKVYDLNKDKPLCSLQHDLGLYAVEFAPGSDNICATASCDGVHVWDIVLSRKLRCLDGHKDEVNGLCYLRGVGSKLASASDDCTVAIWDVQRGEALLRLEGHAQSVYGVCAIDAMDCVATASFDKTCRVWDCRSGTMVRSLSGHEMEVIGVDASPNLLATGSDDRTCRLW